MFFIMILDVLGHSELSCGHSINDSLSLDDIERQIGLCAPYRLPTSREMTVARREVEQDKQKNEDPASYGRPFGDGTRA